MLARVDPAPAAPRCSLSRGFALAVAGALWLAFAVWGLSAASTVPPPAGAPSLLLLPYFLVALLLLFPSIGLLAYALSGFIAWRRCALAWELARRLRLSGSTLELPEEVEYEVGLVEQLEYNYTTPRYVWHSVEGGFKPVARGRGRAVELPAATPFIAVRKAPAIWLRKGSEGYLRAPALRIVSGRYKGLHVLLLSPGGCVERSAAAGGALAKYRSSPEGALLELEWGGGGGVAAGASLRVGTGHWRRRYVAVAELRLRKPGSTRFAVAWGGAKLVVLPELRLEALRQALGAEVVFAGDPAGTPAELEVAVYKPFGKGGRAVPLG
ncbi:MAG: hypothetical protein LM580_12085 [Thermofilum sp.]|nr:hypothetical protein [Thermofilum sp.]